MTNADAFDLSLEAVAEACEDPVPLVYAKLYERHPEVQQLFILDTDHGARGHMFNEALYCAQDLLGRDVFATTFIASERQNHDGYDISANVFEAFYAVLHDVFRDLTGPAWTAEMDCAWTALKAKVAAAQF